MVDFRGKFDGVDTIPLFDKPTQAKRNENKPARVRNVDRRECPECGQKVGIVVGAMRDYRPVLTWRRHWRRMQSGNAFLCAMSETEVAP